MKQQAFLWLLLGFLLPNLAYTQQDSALTFDYEQAQKRLIEQNLQIIANTYEIDIAQAQLTQAKLWTNPYLVWNQDLYSVERNQYFNASNQHLIQVEQTFSISGKHVNSVKLAKMNVKMNRLVLDDIIRGLLMELAIEFSNLQILQRKNELNQRIITQFEQVIANAEQQVKSGYLAGNELTRLKTEYIEMQTNALSLKIDMEKAMSQIRILLAVPNNAPIRVVERPRPLTTNVSLNNLIEISKEIRPDYLLKQQEINYQKQNLKLQRSNAMPDIKLAYQPRDRGSNYVRPYTGFNFEMSLPVFNRNQGGIKEASAKVKQSEVSLQLFENELRQQIMTAFNLFQLQKEGLSRYSDAFLAELEEMQNNAQLNYTRKSISLLEFIDLQRIYLQTQMQQIEIYGNYIQAINQLNFQVGRDIIE